ncbi:MAG: ferredoxin/flavodoxin---NADP+ reductase [Solirubrobacteraceae bacterium]|nr:ferredoxin/flavodoxin---NADP+ reductase [Solirubrobacteraceae bacterium]
MSPSRVAVVGAGPAGFYTAEQLLKEGFEVDLIDALPTPFGLVRAGVAPDHPKIKSVTRMYEKTAAREGFRFFGGIELGGDIERDDLLERYHAVVYAVGTADDNRLGIEGEDRPGSHAATEFVAWYNGHPAYADREFDLSATRAVVIGNGNVAIDVARMLVLDPDELAVTDTADHALEALGAAQVAHVTVLGRRGPAQAAFTNPELRELGELQRADVIVDPAEIELDEHSAAWLEADGDPTAKRNVEMLREYARREPSGKSHQIELRFLRSPLEVIGDEQNGGAVRGLRVVRNEILRDDATGALRARSTGVEEVLQCGLVLRSIGYRGRALPGVPFDERRGLIRNDGGRVQDEDGETLRGEYAVGWIKRGPSGVIGTNKKDAADTVAKVLADAEAGALNEPAQPDAEAIEGWLRERVPGLVTWNGWQAIDEHETGLGGPLGRPRVKLVRVPDMIAVAEAPVGARSRG